MYELLQLFNPGQLVQTFVIIIGGFIALGSMKQEIRHQGDRLHTVDKKIDKLETAFIQLARHDERVSAMDQRVLAQGKRIDRLENARRPTLKEQIPED